MIHYFDLFGVSVFAVTGAMLIVIAVRLAAIHWHLSLPTFQARGAEPEVAPRGPGFSSPSA